VATAFSPWKRVADDMLFPYRIWLQLGHGIFSVETPDRRDYCGDGFLASIGPRHFLRGNSAGRQHRNHEHQASIGPRYFRRGNLCADWSKVSAFPCFNWATAFSPWKSIPNCVDTGGQHLLQLGHGIFAVETGGGPPAWKFELQ